MNSKSLLLVTYYSYSPVNGGFTFVLVDTLKLDPMLTIKGTVLKEILFGYNFLELVDFVAIPTQPILNFQAMFAYSQSCKCGAVFED